MVGRLAVSGSRVERLGGADGPVAVDLVLNRRLNIVVTLPGGGDVKSGLVRELVLEAGQEGDRLVHNALEVAPAVDGLERVVDAILEDLVATGSEELSGHVHTGPVEGVLVVAGLVDQLGPHLLDLAAGHLGVDTEVELVGDFNVNVWLHSDSALLVVLSAHLFSNK